MAPLRRGALQLAERHPNLVIALVIGWITVTTGLVLWVAVQNRELAAQSHQALCSIRGDLDRRVQASQKFLVDHPTGIPGIPVSAIRLDIARTQQTVDSLRFLDCSGNEPPRYPLPSSVPTVP